MDTIGWQLGAFLIGLSSLLVAIYVSKLLNSANKVVENTNRIFMYNERHINQTIENVASLTDDAKDIVSTFNKLTGFIKVFKFIKKN
ncbi:MAG: DUF948 domain-containing protein [Peptostreptococcaceae bacterium]